MHKHLRITLSELEARRAHLLETTARPAGRDLQALLSNTLNRLQALASDIERLLSDPLYQDETAEPYVYRRIRRIVDELDRLEAFPMTALARWDESDARLSRLIERICCEIAFPRPLPIVVGLSQGYYEARPEFDLLFTASAESSFLLHLPDLYHELGHLVVAADQDPKTAPVRAAMNRATQAGLRHCMTESRREMASSRAPHGLARAFDGWATKFDSWAEEFLCDVMAAATCGPAFALAHVHLWMKRGGDPWLVRQSTHPPDAARLECMLFALSLRGFSHDVTEVEELWSALVRGAGLRESAPFRRCFPRPLLEEFAREFLDAFDEVGLAVLSPGDIGPVAATLNEAWSRFRDDSDQGYRAWEKMAAEELFE